MLSYVIYCEKFRNVLHRTENVALIVFVFIFSLDTFIVKRKVLGLKFATYCLSFIENMLPFQLVPFNCGNCQKNFCIRHRNELDHDCKGFEDSGRSGTKAGYVVSNHVKFHHPN